MVVRRVRMVRMVWVMTVRRVTVRRMRVVRVVVVKPLHPASNLMISVKALGGKKERICRLELPIGGGLANGPHLVNRLLAWQAITPFDPARRVREPHPLTAATLCLQPALKRFRSAFHPQGRVCVFLLLHDGLHVLLLRRD